MFAWIGLAAVACCVVLVVGLTCVVLIVVLCVCVVVGVGFVGFWFVLFALRFFTDMFCGGGCDVCLCCVALFCALLRCRRLRVDFGGLCW